MTFPQSRSCIWNLKKTFSRRKSRIILVRLQNNKNPSIITLLWIWILSEYFPIWGGRTATDKYVNLGDPLEKIAIAFLVRYVSQTQSGKQYPGVDVDLEKILMTQWNPNPNKIWSSPSLTVRRLSPFLVTLARETFTVWAIKCCTFSYCLAEYVEKDQMSRYANWISRKMMGPIFSKYWNWIGSPHNDSNGEVGVDGCRLLGLFF